MNIFSNLKSYTKGWETIEEGTLSAEEMAQVVKTEVVPSQFGMSLKLIKKNDIMFVPIDVERSNLQIGDTPNIEECCFVLLTNGVDKIYRVR